MSTVAIPAALIHRLRSSSRLVILTGAGISAESGVPTFREAQTGLWAKYDPLELATPDAFRRNPQLVWEWYAWRRALVNKVHPNAGHLALVTLESKYPHFLIVTQNVDGLHQRAGSRAVIELHGNIHRIKCADENCLIDSVSSDVIPPRCPHCQGLLRPDVVWFSESLPTDALDTALSAIRHCEVLFSIGTSSLVQPAASLPFIALEHNATLVEINLDNTPLTPYAHFSFTGHAGQILPSLVEAAWSQV